MNNLEEYILFVTTAKLAGQKIEAVRRSFNPPIRFELDDIIRWNWVKYDFRVQLPVGWRYLIEAGNTAFREPQDYEYYLDSDYKVVQYSPGSLKLFGKHPIVIKGKESSR